MYHFFSELINPLPILIILAICWAFFYWRKKKVWSKIFFSFLILWFFIISTPIIPDYFVKKLEKKIFPLSENILPVQSKNYKIMVLGSGHINDFSLSYNNQLSKNALGRLIEGIRLYRRIKGSKLILSGYGYDQPLTQAQTLALTAMVLGVTKEDIILYNKTENTSDEAKEYAKQSIPTDTLLLVTDAVHMPRAIKLFTDAGVNPIPVPINHIFKNNKNKTFTYYFPSSNSIAKSEIAMHEYVGMLVSYFE